MKNDFIRNKNIKNQPKKAVKKTFSFYALVFALLFMFIGSTLGSIAFVRTSNIDTNVNIAYADSVYNDYYYLGSNFTKVATRYRTSVDTNNKTVSLSYPIYTDGEKFTDLNIAFGLNQGTVLCNAENNGVSSSFSIPLVPRLYSITSLTGNPTIIDNIFSLNDIRLARVKNNNVLDFGENNEGYSSSVDSKTFSPVYYYYNKIFNGTIDNPVPVQTFTDINFNTYFYNEYVFYRILEPQTANGSVFCKFSTITTYGFNCNVVSVSFGNNGSQKYDPITIDGTTVKGVYYYNYLTYTDNNGRTFTINFEDNIAFSSTADVSTYEYPNFSWNNRTYYLNTALDTDTQGLLTQQKNQLTDEFNTKIAELNQQHAQELSNVRQSAYNEGKNDGLETADDATFLGLFGALFDAPIQAVSGLFNFDVLGFNLWNFFTAVITIGIVIFVVRIFL